MKARKSVLKYCLQNAVFYSGKADAGAVLGKVLAEKPSLRKNVTEIKKEIENTVSEVNDISLEEQKKMLKGIDKELLVKRVKKQEPLPPLKNAKTGRVVTRFAPCPSGPLNLFQVLRAVMISYLYAKKYKGKFILRFEDTDPRKVRKEYYDWIKEDLKNLEVSYDRLVTASEDMGLFYRYCESLLKAGRFYACTCPAERFRELKLKKRQCPCRDRKPGENLKLWKQALRGGFREGEIVIRHKKSMRDPNPALRDPGMFRVLRHRHPLLKKKYFMWPLYNFANVVEDHEAHVTHIFRGKEHQHNETIQNRVYSDLGWKPPYVLNFGMIYLPGEKVHTRDIKEKIKRKELSGWDDPRLHTIRALIRRGFHPEAFRRLAIDVGLTKTDIRISMKNLEGINRKVLDPLANRCFVVTEPVRISVKGTDTTDIKEARLPNHPDFPDRGERRIPVNTKEIFVSKDDFSTFRGKNVRLIGFGNIRLGKSSVYTGDEKREGMQKIHWVSRHNIRVRIVTPEGKKLSGLGEPGMKNLKPGDLIQMERVGFGRVDSVSRGSVTIYFTHR